MLGEIKISNSTKNLVVIDIDGEIGVPENYQFERAGQRVATYKKFKEVLSQIKEIDAPEIVVNIRSSGGDVNDAMLIYEALVESGANVTTRCYGYVASAATIIAQAATKKAREISENALYLIHQSACVIEGNSKELERSIETLCKTDQTIANIYARRSGKSIDVFVELMGRNAGQGEWLSAKEAKECGLVDRVIGAEVVEIDSQAEARIVNMGLPPIPQEIIKKIEKMNNKRNRTQNLKKRWDAILELLGVTVESEQSQVVAINQAVEQEEEEAPETETAVEPDQTEQNQVEQKTDEQEQEQNQEQQRELEVKAMQIESLKNRVSQLEVENARLTVTASMTSPKEDPSVHQSERLSVNEEAYVQDVMRMR